MSGVTALGSAVGIAPTAPHRYHAPAAPPPESAVTPETLFAARRAARAQARAKDDALAAAHARVFARMAADPAFEAEVRAMARERVARWQATQICNERYIVAWTRLLALPVNTMAADVLQADGEGPALRANTAFVGYLRDDP